MALKKVCVTLFSAMTDI